MDRFPPDTMNAVGNWYPYQNDYNTYYWTWQIWYTNCMKCQGQVSSNDKFCPHCGEALWVAETTDEKLNRVLLRLKELEELVQSLQGSAK